MGIRPADDEATTESDEETDERPTHLDDVDDGCGCVELWEQLSEKRD